MRAIGSLAERLSVSMRVLDQNGRIILPSRTARTINTTAIEVQMTTAKIDASAPNAPPV
jgi:hypothetical protein